VIRVLLVDDQPLVRAGLHRILAPRFGFDVVAECEDGDEVPRAVERHRPDLVVMDVRMRRVDGAEATRALQATDDPPPVLILTTYDDDEVLSTALRAGAAGFQLKDAPGEDIIRAARAVAEGRAWLDPAVTGRVLQGYRRAAPEEITEPPAALTAREVDVLKLVARGSSNTEIAGTLHVSEATVKTHIGNLFTKLGRHDRAALIVYAYDTGVVRPGLTT
jgi:DNA-binding NarL/FixJ family response regulator